MTFKLKTLSCALIGAASLLSACDQRIAVQDGKIPEVLLENARQWEGNYIGSFEDRIQELTLTLDGDVPSVQASVDFTGDTLCSSKAGKLRHIVFRKKEKQLVELEFEFNTGLCAKLLRGQTLYLQAKLDPQGKLETLRYAFLKRIRARFGCEPHQDPATGAGGARCGVRQVKDFAVSGPFTRR
jgi:hypothetical protein